MFQIKRIVIFYSVGVVFSFVLGFFAHYYYYQYRSGSENQFLAVRQENLNYPHIKPLLICAFSENREYQELTPLEDKINRFIEQEKNMRQVTDVSVYFRDLETGHWTGIQQDQEYNSASLLKVAIMMSYFRLAEFQPNLLSREIVYTADSAIQKEQKKDIFSRVAPNKPYTVNELIRVMIINSDNTAKDILLKIADTDVLKEIFTDLGIHVSQSSQGGYRISTKAYSLFFRLLYNSTFLSKPMSEKALALLTESDFSKGLALGTPKDIAIAHKFGVNETTGADTELHDCGIVYAKPNPYLLCVMTRGANVEKLAAVIAGVSKIVYTEIR